MKVGIYIGRFQPPHDGHIQAMAHIAAQVDLLYIMVGSSNLCRSIKNPWTFGERSKMIKAKMRSRGIVNFTVVPLNDHKYNDPLWITEVRTKIAAIDENVDEIILFGHSKDGNDYLTWFPDLKFKEVPAFAGGISATQIREAMFADPFDTEMPATVRADWNYFNKEKQLFKDYPFPDTLNFNCADVVVECQGHILLIQRKFAPGAGSWALPGGFKNNNETFLDCAIRELIEETNLRIPEKVLRGSIVETKMFDSPTRGMGIPRNTLAVYIRVKLDADGMLPRANGTDDASKAQWCSLNDVLNSMTLFDDHSAIISDLIGVSPSPLLGDVA